MPPEVLPIFQGQFHLERVNILLQLNNKRSGASNVGHKDFHGISDLVGGNKHFVDLSFNFDFLQASHADSQRRIFPQLQVVLLRCRLHSRLLRIDQVTDVLVVDLEEGYFDLVLSVHFEVVEHGKYLFHSLVHYTGCVLATKHRVRLACACGTVSEHSAVEAIEHTFDQVLRGAIEHFARLHVAVEGEIECELLLAGTVFP